MKRNKKNNFNSQNNQNNHGNISLVKNYSPTDFYMASDNNKINTVNKTDNLEQLGKNMMR